MKNFNADYVNSIIQLNAEPRAYIEIETDLGYSIFATTHKDLLIGSPVAPYQFNFNGNGYIETQRRWNPDATDPSFNFQWFGDVTMPLESLVIGQNASQPSSSRELAIFTESTGNLRVHLGGGTATFINTGGWAGNNTWLFKFIFSTNTMELYLNGVLQESKPASFGAFRSPLVSTFLAGDPSTGARYEVGVQANCKLWTNAETTNDLVLDMPINDLSNTIKDYAGVNDGALTAGTGNWQSYHLLDGVITSLTTASESITPEKGFSVLGGGSVGLLEAQMTNELRDLYNNQETIFNKKAHIYSGTADIAIDDYEKVQTLYVQDISNSDVSYSINLQTAQIFSNKKLFEVQTTELFKSFTSNETLTSIEVLSTDGFSLVEHDSQWQDSPDEEVGYLNFTGQDAEGNPVFEIVKYWSKDATKFYGDPGNGGKIQRSCFNTGRVTATGTSEGGSATEIREHIYIDLAAGKMILALLTGELYGQAGKTLPDGWHAGVDSSLVNITSLENIGFDLWNPSDDTGFHFYIDQPEASTAKTYIAREILRVASLAFLTDVNGEIKAKRFQQVIPNSGAQVYLDNNDILNKPVFDRKSSSIRNVFAVKWDYRAQIERFVRTEAFVDIDSINKNNVTSRAENIELKAVRNNSIEVNELLKTVTDGIRTRLTNPYIKPSIQSTFRRSLQLEAMDVIGLDLVGFSDYGASGDINRPFEIQEIQHDWLNRTVSMQVFGSTDPASPVNISETATTAVIDHTGWRKFEDYLTGSFTDTGTVLTLTSNCDLGSGADIGFRRDYYYNGLIDFNGFDLRISGTVVIDANLDISSSRILGDGRGGFGGDGQDDTSINSTTIKGDTGYFGTYDSAEEGAYLVGVGGPRAYKRRAIRPASIATKDGVGVIENFVVSVDANGKLNGLPEHLNGRSGSGGMRTYPYPSGAWSDGGYGAHGGCGLVILADDFIYNNSSSIVLDAQAGVGTTSVVATSVDGYTGYEVAGGRGGAGWGGCLAVIIKNRSKPLFSNVDGVFSSKTSVINNWSNQITRPDETNPNESHNASGSDAVVPFRNISAENAVNGVDYANSALLSKYIGGEVASVPIVGRDVIAQVAAPQSLTLTPALDTPSTPDGNQITVTCNVVAPIDDNYSFTIFTYKNSTESAYYDTKYTVSNEASFTVTGNGKTYTVKAQSVSKQGVLGGYITENITVKNVLTEPAIEPEVTPQRVSGLRLRNSIASNVQDKFKSGNAEFLWNAVSKNNSVQFGQEGLLGASSGGYDAWFKDYQVNIYDSSAVLLRTEFTKSESYTYTLEKNKTDNAGREFFIQVLSRGQNNQVSDGVLFKVENPAPAAVTSLSAKVGYNSIQVDFVSPNDIDYKGVNMRYRKIGLAWSAALFVAGTSCNVANLEGATEYEIELTTVDEFGVGTATSITATTVDIHAEQVSGLSAWATETDQVDLAFINANMDNDAIESDKIASLVAGKISAGQVDVAVDIGTGVKLDGTTGTVKTINSGFGTILGTADGAWNQLPNPTVITSIDTTTDIQTFGVDTAGNTIIGNGDNSVLFNQATNTIDFGANVTIGSNVDQTVTVGAGGDFSTINLALEHLSKIVPAYKSGGFTAEISILSGTTINEQIHLRSVDLSFVTISSVDSIVYVSGSGFVTVDSIYPFISIKNGSTSPDINVRFQSNADLVGMVGLYVSDGNSSASIRQTKGFTHFSQNVNIDNGGNVFGIGGVYTDAIDESVYLNNNATARLEGSDFNDSSTAFYVARSKLSVYNSTAQSCETVIYIAGGEILASSIDAKYSENMVISYGGDIDLELADLSEYATSGGFVIHLISATDINLISANMKNSTTLALNRTFMSANDSFINAAVAEFKIGPSSKAEIQLYSTTINATYSGFFDITASSGSIVRASSSITYTTNLVAVTNTVNGILYN